MLQWNWRPRGILYSKTRTKQQTILGLTSNELWLAETFYFVNILICLCVFCLTLFVWPELTSSRRQGYNIIIVSIHTSCMLKKDAFNFSEKIQVLTNLVHMCWILSAQGHVYNVRPCGVFNFQLDHENSVVGYHKSNKTFCFCFLYWSTAWSCLAANKSV